MSVPKCTSWLGHEFEGRYSRVYGVSLEVDGTYPSAAQIEACKDKRTYERDICIRCGHTIEKQGAN